MSTYAFILNRFSNTPCLHVAYARKKRGNSLWGQAMEENLSGVPIPYLPVYKSNLCISRSLVFKAEN